MQRHQQRMLRPFALVAPGRGQHRLRRDRRTACICADKTTSLDDADCARLLFEPADFVQRVTAQTGDVHRRRVSRICAARSSSGAGRLHERVQADAEQRARIDPGSPPIRSTGRRLWEREPDRRTCAVLRRAAAGLSSRLAGGRDRRYSPCVNPDSAADRPELQSQTGELARNVHGNAAGVLELFPQSRRFDRARNTANPA